MADAPAHDRDAWITGIGLVSSLGEGCDAHWDAFVAGKPVIDTENFAPFPVHPLAQVNFDAQIPKKGDQRQMEGWQRIGTYAAGLALDSAGVKGNADILSRMDMIVAASGGERDVTVDCSILDTRIQGQATPSTLNERLMSDLRPTLFLAQLSNLLAGNISIVHGVTGSSRTFMGEEGSGIEAVRIALARIAAGQSDIALVGASLNGQRKDQILIYELAGLILKNECPPVWARTHNSGFALGSAGAFLVIESREHAQNRGAHAFAQLKSVVSGHANRNEAGALTRSLQQLWHQIDTDRKIDTLISGVTGAEPATGDERAFLETHGDVAVRGITTLLGHTLEAQFPFAVAIAALAAQRRTLFPPLDRCGVEHDLTGPVQAVSALCVGHGRGEGMALLLPVEGGMRA